MPICQNCEKKWTWQQSFKRMISFKQRLKCPYCGSKQYESTASRKKTSMIGLLPIFIILPMNILSNLTWLTVIPIIILMVLVTLSLYPFVLKLSNEEEPYW